MIRRPPRSTPSPSPPLFQSKGGEGPRRSSLPLRCPRLLAGGRAFRGRDTQRIRGLVDVDRARHQCATDQVDRKGTRLNSSHTCIPYAVFFFKNRTPVDLAGHRRRTGATDLAGHVVAVLDEGG